MNESIKQILNDNIAVGKAIAITEELRLVPVYKVNINHFTLDTKVEDKGLGSNTNISVTPLCLLQILDNRVTLVSLTEKNTIIDKVPNILETLSGTCNLNDLFSKEQ